MPSKSLSVQGQGQETGYKWPMSRNLTKKERGENVTGERWTGE